MRKTYFTSAAFLGLTTLMITFNNCSKVNFASTADVASTSGFTTPSGATSTPPTSTPTASATPAPAPPPVTEAIANCQQAAAQNKLKSKITTLNFNDTKTESGRSQVCIFAPIDGQETSDGNLSELNNYLRSRYEQSQTLDLPANAVICNIAMKTDKQSFKYDDVFYLTYNNKVIASNLKASLKTLKYDNIRVGSDPSNIPLYDYQWVNGVRNQSFAGVNDKADDYCLGSDEGHASCSWPLSQQSGDIKFSFDQELLINIGVTASATNQRFGFAITGDNDPSTDCYHEALSFDTTVSYYER
jgi:hypothetical protein